MNKHERFGAVLWAGILLVIVYNIGIIPTIILTLGVIVLAGLYIGIP